MVRLVGKGQAPMQLANAGNFPLEAVIMPGVQKSVTISNTMTGERHAMTVGLLPQVRVIWLGQTQYSFGAPYLT